MNTAKTALMTGMAVLVGLAFAGCTSRDRHVEPKDYSGPRESPVRPGPEEELAPPPEHGRSGSGQRDTGFVQPPERPLRPAMTAAEKQEIGRKALFDLQRMSISSAEWLKLSDGDERTEVARDLLVNRLEELGYHVAAATRVLPFNPSETDLRHFREGYDCNLVFLMQGEAKMRNKFGDFYGYKAELKGRVLNLTTYQEIASKTIRKNGDRALDEVEAAQDALESAAADLATYLTDEVSRKWEVTSLMRMRLVVTDIDHAQEADDVRIGLQRRPGIYYVSLERWDKQSDTAVYEVLCRFDVREYLVGYVDELRIGRIQVERVERDKVIKADQDLAD